MCLSRPNIPIQKGQVRSYSIVLLRAIQLLFKVQSKHCVPVTTNKTALLLVGNKSLIPPHCGGISMF